MASSDMINWDVAVRIESELHQMLKDPKITHEDLNRHLDLFRLAIISITTANFQEGVDHRAEPRLWDVACAINDRFRKALAKFKGNDRKEAVEKNKLAKRYATFIKTSQFFYKGCIQRLDSQYDGIPELRKIAHKLDLGNNTEAQQTQPTPELQSAILKSVHATLLHLGDLSRYRNELRTKDKNWNHALAYYGLAADLIPEDGSAYNQMAMVGLKDGNHLYGVYYLYRAFAVEEPHPRAKNNLELEFKKLISLWKSGSSDSAHYTPAENAAINWLLRLHALLYKGGLIANHDEVETEVICQTTALLKDQSLEQDILIKFAIINIAGERLALDRMIETPSHNNTKSYFGFLRLNVRTFFMLLQVLQTEFRSDEYDDLPGNVPQPDMITPVMRHILPALRHYSIWLVSQAENICENTFGEACGDRFNGDMALIDNLKIYVKEMWRLYASTLCLFCTAFPPKELHEVKDVNYLLDEDAATIGFKPFTDQEIAPFCDIYYEPDGIQKPRSSDQGVEVEDPEHEMVTRIKTIVRDGVVIAHSLRNTPIKIAEGEEGVFYFIEERLPTIRPTSGHSPGRSMSSMEMKRTLSQRDELRGYPLGMTVMPDTEFTHESVDQRMNNMVEQLIGSREDTYGMNTRFANELFGEMYNGMGNGTPTRSSPWQKEHPHQQTFQSGQAANGYMLPVLTPDRFQSHQLPQQSSQDTDNVPRATDQDYNFQQASPKIIPDEEMDRHLQMFENPFGGSSWNKRSSIFAGTSTPYKSNQKSPEEATRLSTPAYAHHRHSSSSLAVPVPFSSGPGAYGDSRSYERAMLQSSLSRPSGEADQMQMYTSGQRG